MLQRLKNRLAKAWTRRQRDAAGATAPVACVECLTSAPKMLQQDSPDLAATPALLPTHQADAGSSGDAIAMALHARPDDADLNYRMGLLLLRAGDAAGALDFLHLALHYAPEMFSACAARVAALVALGRGGEAADAYRDFLQSNPGDPDAAYALALWHHAKGEFEPAVELLRPLALNPSPRRDICNLLGLILGRELGQLEAGERFLRQALVPDPLWPVALSNLGWILLEKGDYQEGLRLLDVALARNPDDYETRLMRAYMNLKRGEFAMGWRDFEARHHSSFAAPKPYRFAPWDGTPARDKTLLIYGEQGLGDQIMFASCFGEAIARVQHCIVECDPKLVALFARSFPSARVQADVSAQDEPAWLAPAGPVDFQIPMGSLPGYWRRNLGEFPRHKGYLRAAPERIAYWRARLDALGPGPKIGLSWRGGVAATRRHLRSIALGEFLPLLRSPGKFVSLQYGDCTEDLDALKQTYGVSLPHWQDALEDYDETAALVCALDLVISVCTAVIHLSGALGKPVWVLVPAVPEWRYLDHGDTLPWYPSARLYRQAHTKSGWGSVLNQVMHQLARQF